MVKRRMRRIGLAALSAILIPGLAGCNGQSDPAAAAMQGDYATTPYPSVRASTNPAVIARGRYLFTAVAHCTACHAPEASLAGRTPQEVAAADPVGGHVWEMGPIGTIRSPNITPNPAPSITPYPSIGIGSWTDGEIARAIKYAVDRKGHALIFMNGLGNMDDRDLTAVISYLRTLPPRPDRVERTEISDEGRRILTQEMPGFLQPKPQRPVAYAPAGELSIRRGAYLANGPARCVHCHSSVAVAPKIALDGPAFAGGLWPEIDRDDPTMEMVPPNLTPSVRFGAITGWTEGAFVQRFKAGGRTVRLSTMPWDNFQLMTDTDLRSIYRYLRSLKPVERNTGPSYRPRGWTADPS